MARNVILLMFPTLLKTPICMKLEIQPRFLHRQLQRILLANYTSDNYYLDNQRGTVTIGDNGIENDYQSKMAALGYKVYAHVDTTSNIIQYWFFYAFNGGDLNRHEGDWEMIQVVLSETTNPSHV